MCENTYPIKDAPKAAAICVCANKKRNKTNFEVNKLQIS